MTGIQLFNYQGKQIRTVEKSGEPWFVAKDVCEVLEIGNSRMALDRISPSMKGVSSIDTLGGKQEMAVINEAGVYKLAFTSRKEEAERFTDWVAAEVLPTIRKHGAYMTPATIEKALTDPDFIIGLATRLKEAQAQIEKDKPKVLFASAVESSHTSILVGELAKIIKQNGVDMGQNRLFDWLRENGYLIKRNGTDYNMPSQRSMEMGLFEIKERTINNPDGTIQITKTTLVSGKGQIYFINKFVQQKQENF